GGCGQRLGGFELGERPGHGWSLGPSISRPKGSITTEYFAPMLVRGTGTRASQRGNARRPGATARCEHREDITRLSIYSSVSDNRPRQHSAERGGGLGS